MCKRQVAPREKQQEDAQTVDEFIDQYLAERVDLKPSSVVQLQQVQKNLRKFVGEKMTLREFTAGHADAFKASLASKMADNSVRRNLGRSRQFFEAAVRKRLIDGNPFAHLKGLTSKGNAERLSTTAVLYAQVKRMLADPRSEALSSRFAAQWLRLQDVDKVRPDAFWFPDYDQQLSDAMQKETQLFFNSIVKEDRSVLELFTANYTFVNDRLARHYGMSNVAGKEFRKVLYPDSSRRGLLGQGSILVQTSLANRTSPVLRGKWVMEVLIGMPPPPPPPNVPTLDETADGKDGRQLSTRERIEMHRKNPVCSSCHLYMDPIGLSLDNFDVTGKYRFRENAVLLDTRGSLYDGTPVGTEAELVRALMRRPIPIVRSFTENLMAYALGRRVEDYDQPTIRVITRDAQANGYKMSSFITAVVHSSAFRSKRAEVAATADTK